MVGFHCYYCCYCLVRVLGFFFFLLKNYIITIYTNKDLLQGCLLIWHRFPIDLIFLLLLGIFWWLILCANWLDHGAPTFGRSPSIMWVGLSRSVGDLHRTKTDSLPKQDRAASQHTAFGLLLQLLPEPPACLPSLQTLDSQTSSNVCQFPENSLTGLFLWEALIHIFSLLLCFPNSSPIPLAS